MKKSIYVFIGILFIFMMLLTVTNTTMAASLDNIEVEVSKTKIAPGEEVTVTVNFGANLGAYTINAAYDNALFDYVRVEGGAATNHTDRIKLVYPNTVDAVTARTSASITFKAKQSITTSNPTDFAITLEGLAETDPANTFDDITTPIKKDVLVEPNYVDYSLLLNYTGDIEKNVGKNMTLVTSSTMGKNYDHVRLIAELTKEPSNAATAKLIATNNDGTQIDLIQNGWGEAQGYSIGGKDVKQELKLLGEFSQAGEYAIHIKLIDRDNSDSVIVEKTFNLNVVEEKTVQKPDETQTPSKPTQTQKPSQDTEKLPEQLPTTGTTQYALAIFAIFTLLVGYFLIKQNKNK